MGGALIHIVSGILLGSVVHSLGYKREFVFASFVGTLFPDILKYFLIGVYQGNFNFFYVINTPVWKGMKEITIWEMNLMFTMLFTGIALLLYEIHVIKNKNFWEVERIDMFLFAGILVHLIIDLVWIETGWLL
jgi:hypothetical protein